MMNFDGWWNDNIGEYLLSGKERAELAWEAATNAALERAAKVCDEADKSIHPAELADRIRMLKD